VRHVLSLVDDRVVVVAAALLTLAALATWPVSTVWRQSRWLVFVGLASIVLIVVLTLANRAFIGGSDVGWFLDGWGGLPTAVVDPGWWLNLALFVPAGWAWTQLTRRPGVVVIALAATSFLIESLHATKLAGIGDPADLVANVLGATVGALLARRLGPSGLTRAERPSDPGAREQPAGD
jgi:hypothetical protein